MKAYLKNHSNLCFVLVLLAILLADPTNAQTFTTLHNFSARAASGNYQNTDGASPNGALVLSGSVLYGTGGNGGAANMGTVFRLNTDGTGFSTLFNCTGAADALYPTTGLILSGSTLIGASLEGGQQFAGSIFAGSTSGSGYTALFSFNSGNGIEPLGQILLSGGYIYGTTYTNGSMLNGTIYKVSANGTGFTVLHNFTSTSGGINTDGANTYAGLTISGTTLYGAATFGGSHGYGTLFKINTDGSAFTVLHTFAGTTDGIYPVGGLICSNNVLYGTADDGGSGGYGTIFKLNTDGTGFTVLHSFEYADGSNPQGALLLATNVLYGTAVIGGSGTNGAIFAINTDGTGYTNLHNFSKYNTGTTNNSDGAQPCGALVLSGNALYGAALGGGTGGSGTIFKMTIPAAQTVTNTHPAFFNGEILLGGGVYYLGFTNNNFFGLYTYAFWPYLYHYDMGFEYYFTNTDSANGAYLYDFTSGHFWYTSPSYPFPNVYDFNLNSIIYYFPNSTNSGHYTANPRQFYNYTKSNFFTQ